MKIAIKTAEALTHRAKAATQPARVSRFAARLPRLLLAGVFSALVVACGGGGGGPDSATTSGANPTNSGGSTVSCVSVKSGFSRDIETTPASDGRSGSDGGGQDSDSSGGAAAGGGLGKVLGGLLTVTDLSDGSLVGSAITDSTKGLVTIKTCDKPGPFLLTLSGQAGAKYYDEGKDALVDFPAGTTLHALVDQWDEHVGVSPITEAAYRYALNNFKANPASVASGSTTLRSAGDLSGLTKAQVIQANNVVRDAINAAITTNLQLASAKSLPTPLDASNKGDSLTSSRYGKSAAINGGLVKMANFYNLGLGAPALSLTQQFARDLTDSRIDGFALDGTPAAVESASYESTRFPLANQIGNNAMALSFGSRVLQSTTLSIDEYATLLNVGNSSNSNVSGYCNPYFDEIGLMSNGSVNLRRVTSNGTSGAACNLFTNTNPQILIKDYLTGVKQIASSFGVAYAVKRDGTVLGWGENYCGQILPAEGNAIYSTPQPIPGLRNISSIASDFGSVIAVDEDGNVFQLGVDSTLNGLTTLSAPAGRTLCFSSNFGFGVQRYYKYNAVQKVTGLPPIAKVFTKTGTNFALARDGRLFAWGAGTGGLLANGAVLSDGVTLGGPAIITPAQIAGIPLVRDLAFDGYFAHALAFNGQVFVWGSDSEHSYVGGIGYVPPYGAIVTRPKLAFTRSDISQIVGPSSGGQGLKMLTRNGDVLALGNTYFPAERISRTFLVPTAITLPDSVRKISQSSPREEQLFYFSTGRVGNIALSFSNDLTPRFR